MSLSPHTSLLKNCQNFGHGHLWIKIKMEEKAKFRGSFMAADTGSEEGWAIRKCYHGEQTG